MTESNNNQRNSSNALDASDPSILIPLPETTKMYSAAIGFNDTLPVSDHIEFVRALGFDLDAVEQGSNIKFTVYVNGFRAG